MKCINCKGDIPGDYKGQTCPSCGEPIPVRRPVLFEWGERVAGFTHDRGFIFWLIAFSLILFLIAALEHLFAHGELARLLDQYKFINLLSLVYVTGHLKLIRNINTEIRPGYPGPYWTDRLIIKKFRRGTNLMLILGLITSFIIVGPFNILALWPAYVLIMSLYTAAFWSVASFRVDDKEFLDAKVQSYFDYLGVKKLMTWRKAGGVYMIGIVVSAGIFYGLSHVHGLWWMIKGDPTLNEIIETLNGLFDWVPQIMTKK